MDEVQYALPKALYKPIFFTTEEEASQYRVENKLSMGVHFSEKLNKYFLDGTNELYSDIEQSIRDSEQHLGLRVEIGFEVITGRDWSECH